VPPNTSGECWFSSNYFNQGGLSCRGELAGNCTGGAASECDGVADNVAIDFRTTSGPGTCTVRAFATNRHGDTASASTAVTIGP
jgi:hypothetical protein